MNIVIVDDDNLVSLSLKTILEASPDVTIAGMGCCGAEAVTLYDTIQPDILLMDIQMKGMSGLEAGAKILEKYPDAKILLLTTFNDDEYIIKALHLGVKGYILKQNFTSILPALLAVYNGQTVFGDAVIEKIPNLMRQSTNPDVFKQYHLTQKELDIIERVANGRNNKEIAHDLFLSEGTVRNYLSTILEKLELRDRTQLAVFYYRRLRR